MRLLEASDIYLRAKKAEGYSPRTLESYALQHQLLVRHLGDVDITLATTQQIRDYLADLAGRVKPVTVANRVRTLHAFFKWMVQEELLEIDPTVRIKEPKEGIRVPKALTEEQIEIIREACKSPREHALVEFFFATGARLAEVVGLDVGDLDFQNRSAVVRGKGDKEREVYWGHKANIHLKRYLDGRRGECPALFSTVNRPYKRAEPHTLYHEIKKVAKRCNLEKFVSPHKYRHTLATMLLNNGADISVIQSLLGHAKPSTTMIYVTLRGTRRKSEYDRYFMQ